MDFKCNYRDIYGNIKQKKSKKFSTKEEAKFLLTVGESKRKSLTFDDIYNKYIEKKKDYVRPQAILRKNNLYKYINKYLGDVKINNLTLEKYEKFKSELNKLPIGTDYKNTIHKLVITLINYSDTFYDVNNKIPKLSGGFKDPFKQKKEMDFFNPSEFKQFCTVITDDFWLTLFKVLFCCGLRQGELQALNWNDIDFDLGTISVNKTLTKK